MSSQFGLLTETLSALGRITPPLNQHSAASPKGKTSLYLLVYKVERLYQWAQSLWDHSPVDSGW